MGGRGTGAIRNSDSNTKFSEDKYKNINPGFKQDASNLDAAGYNNNCVKCAIAFEANMRGNDVEAQPFKFGDPDDLTKSRGVAKAFDQKDIWTVGRAKREYTIKEIELMMKEDFGSGSRAIIQEESAGRRHTMNVINLNGKVIIVDAQAGKQGTVKDMLKGLDTKNMILFRTDNMSLNKDYTDWAYRKRKK